MTEVDRMGKFHKAIELQGSGTFLLAVNIVGHGAPTEHTEAEPGMIYMDVDSENGDLYKCIKVTITEQGSIWLWKKLVESQELEILKKEIATKANKTGWTANKYLGTDASGNMVEKEAPQTGTGGITEETDPTVPSWAKQAKKPTYNAEEVGARPNTWMPTATDVGALPDTTQIPAATSDLDNDSGYITIAVATLLNYYLKTETYAKTETYSQTEVDNLISGLDKRLNAIADSGDVDLDQMSELVAYIKANKSLIDSITTSKVNVSDIVDNLTTADSKKPLSAAQGKALKAMYDALPAWAKAANKPTYSKSDVGLGNVDNVKQYSASNPPPYPVKSVNGKTGAVTLGAADVGAATAEQFERLSKEIADQQTEVDGKQPKGDYALRAELATEVTAREQAVADLNARLGQQTLLIAKGATQEEALAWLETNGDKTKVYLMPDDFFYWWTETTEVGGVAYENKLLTSTGADRKTIFNGTGYKTGVRLSGSSGNESSSAVATYGISGFISAKAGDVLRVKNFLGVSQVAAYVIAYDSTNTQTGNIQNASWMVGISDKSEGYGEVTLDEATFGAGFDAVRLCLNGLDGETIITINQEINEGGGTVIVEKWASTGHTLTSSDFSESIANLINITNTHTAEISALKSGGVSSANSIMYISPDGDDDNSGLTVNLPKKTVAACVNAGATRISAKRGVYAEKILLYDIGELEIFPTDNDQDYTNNGNWEPIVFDVSDGVEVNSFAAYNAIKRVAYSNANNEQFNKVFVAKSQTPLYGGDYGSRYNSTIWLLSEDEKTVCIKLKPVLTVAECEAETNTFTYVDGYIYINADWTSVKKVVVPTNWGTGMSIVGAQKVVLREVEVRFSGAYNLEIKNCAYIDLYKCFAKYTSYASGFHPVNVNGVFNSCYATKNYDGFGVNGCGHTTYIDCVSEFNFDDGVSHHAESEGTFIGGRYEGNGKGGNTPAYGAKVNIYGGIYKDNATFGIGYLYASSSGKADGTVQGAVMVGNPVGLAVNANCTVTAIDCKYSGNTADKEIKGNFTEY